MSLSAIETEHYKEHEQQSEQCYLPYLNKMIYTAVTIVGAEMMSEEGSHANNTTVTVQGDASPGKSMVADSISHVLDDCASSFCKPKPVLPDSCRRRALCSPPGSSHRSLLQQQSTSARTVATHGTPRQYDFPPNVTFHRMTTTWISVIATSVLQARLGVCYPLALKAYGTWKGRFETVCNLENRF